MKMPSTTSPPLRDSRSHWTSTVLLMDRLPTPSAGSDGRLITMTSPSRIVAAWRVGGAGTVSRWS